MKRCALMLTVSGLACGLGVGVLGGCKGQRDLAADPPELRPRVAAPTYRPKMRPITEMVSAGGRAYDGRGPLVDRMKLEPGVMGPQGVETTVIGPEPEETMRVRLAVRQATPEQVLQVLLEDTLGVSYIIDPELARKPGEVTLQIDEEMSVQDVRDLVTLLAELHGWSIEDRGDLMVVGPTAKMPVWSGSPLLDGRTMLDSAETAMRVFRPTYVNANDVLQAMRPFMTPGSQIVATGNVLVLVDRVSQLNRMAGILRALDAAPFSGTEVWTYRLRHASNTAVGQALTQIAQGVGFGSRGGSPAVGIVPVQGRDELLVISRDPTIQRAVQQWIETFDQPASTIERERFIYRVQHYPDVNQLRTYISEAFTENMERALGATGDDGMRITLAGERTLMFYARPDHYAEVLDVLAALDQPPQQVMIKTQIAEVQLNDELEFGVEAFLFEEIDGTIVDSFLNAANAFGLVSPLGTVAITGASGQAIIRALESETDVRILSEPSLFAANGSEALFRVGGEVPIVRAFQDSSIQTGGNTGIRNEVEYRETGILVRVQPRINESGQVTMEIEQEITDVLPNQTSGIDSPQFTTREYTSNVIVPHNQTVILAGTIEERATNQVNGVPLISSIPIVGEAFKNRSNESTRVEIVLMLTPIIVTDPTDVSYVYEDMLDQTRLLRNALADFERGRFDEGRLRQLEDANQLDPEPELLGMSAFDAPAAPQVVTQVGTLEMSDAAAELRAFADMLRDGTNGAMSVSAVFAWIADEIMSDATMEAGGRR